MKLFYKIWADAITFEKTKNDHLGNWKIYTILGVSFCQGLNLFGIFLLLKSFGIPFSLFLEINLFPGELLDKVLSSTLVLYCPPILFNYLMIFHGKKYEVIIEKYKSSSKVGKWYGGYFLFSAFALFLPLIFFKWIW